MRTERGAKAGPLAWIALVALAVTVPAATPPTPEASEAPRELRVGPDGDAATVAGALERARDGDRIVIGPGVYREGTLTVERSVTLEGDGWPVLDGEGTHTVMVVTAPDVTVRGLVLRGAGVSHVRDHAALLLEEAHSCRVEGNRLEENFFGVYLARVEGCVVADNEITAVGTREASSGNGIHLWNATGAEIRDNRIAGHRDGIYLEFAQGTVIRDNLSEDNIRYGLHFMFSDKSVYERNTFRRNTTAIFSDGSDRLTFRQNRVARNGWAVKIMASSQANLFAENDFVENTFDVTTNSRRNFNTFRGNHWSQYDGYDLNGDGVGDVPYRPVRLFSLVVQQAPVALVLLGSFFVELLDMAERVLPVLTPETLVDDEPRMRAVTT